MDMFCVGCLTSGLVGEGLEALGGRGADLRGCDGVMLFSEELNFVVTRGDAEDRGDETP